MSLPLACRSVAAATPVGAPRPRGDGSTIGWLLAALLSVLLGLVLTTAGSPIEAGATALAEIPHATGEQASNHDGPGQPPLRELDAELRDGADDHDDHRLALRSSELPAVATDTVTVGCLQAVDRERGPVERGRSNHDARGPPRA